MLSLPQRIRRTNTEKEMGKKVKLVYTFEVLFLELNDLHRSLPTKIILQLYEVVLLTPSASSPS